MPEIIEQAEQILTLAKRAWAGASQHTADLSEPEFLTLDHLADGKTDYVGRIQHYVGVLPAQMTRMLARLESAGYARCERNLEDKRKVDVSITDAGRKAHAKYREAKVGRMLASLERLAPAERDQFMALIRKMIPEE